MGHPLPNRSDGLPRRGEKEGARKVSGTKPNGEREFSGPSPEDRGRNVGQEGGKQIQCLPKKTEARGRLRPKVRVKRWNFSTEAKGGWQLEQKRSGT